MAQDSWQYRLPTAFYVFFIFIIWPGMFIWELATLPRLWWLRRAAFGAVYESRREGGRWFGRRCVSPYPQWTFEERAIDPAAVVRAKRFTFLETYDGHDQATEAPLLELRLDGGEKVVLEAEQDGHALDDLMDDLRQRGVLDDRRRRQLTYVSFAGTLVFGGIWLVAILIGYAVLRRLPR